MAVNTHMSAAAPWWHRASHIATQSVLTLTAALALLALPYRGATAAPQTARILMNWFAQPDQAGFWQAQIDTEHNTTGLKISVQQGGPKIQTIPQVAAGQAGFGVANADDILLARYRGAPIKAIYAYLDYAPYALLYHPNPKIHSLADLKHDIFAVNIGFAYWEWLKKTQGLEGVHEIPVSGDITMFKMNQNMVQQGYSIFLPYRMDAAGIPNAEFQVASLGYRPYAALFTTDAMIAKHPALVRAVIAKVKSGWKHFIANPAATRALILGMNSQMSPQVVDHAVKDIVATLLPKNPAKLGCMTPARWQELAGQLHSANLLPPKFAVASAYDLRFNAGCH